MPRLNTRIGQRYTVLVTEGLGEFERQQLQSKAALNQLKQVINVQSGQSEPRSLKERTVRKERLWRSRFFFIDGCSINFQ